MATRMTRQDTGAELYQTDAISVIERDIARARARRIEKERAAAKLTILSAPVKPQSSPAPNGATGSLYSSPELISKSELPDAEIVMIDHDTSVRGGSGNESDIKEDAIGLKTKSPDIEVTGTDAMPANSQSAGLAIDLKPSVPSSKAASPSKQPSPAQPQIDTFDPSNLADKPVTDIDFDSMFNDLGGDSAVQGDNKAVMDLNFDLDFSDPAFANAQNPVSLNTSGVDGTSGPDNNVSADHPNEDINTLLPGLENLVSDPAALMDLSAMNLPNSNSDGTAPNIQGVLASIEPLPNPSMAGAGPLPINDNSAKDPTSIDNLFNLNDVTAVGGSGSDNAMADSTFDDLLGGDWNSGGGGAGGVSTADIDSWFNTGV